MTVLAFLKKYFQKFNYNQKFDYNLRKTRLKKTLSSLGQYNNEVLINTVIHFFMNEKLFELCCIENDFAKYFAIAVTSRQECF